MAVAEVHIKKTLPQRNFPNPTEFVPVSVISDWVDINTKPEEADNSGSTVVQPNLITKATQGRLYNDGVGTTLQIRLKYDTGISVPTSPVVQPFGFDGAGNAQRLVDADGEHELTLTIDLTNDVRDGSFKYTQPVEVDMDANASVLVAIKTALAATGTVTNSVIQARVK